MVTAFSTATRLQSSTTSIMGFGEDDRMETLLDRFLCG